jgi:hypothetical protein
MIDSAGGGTNAACFLALTPPGELPERPGRAKAALGAMTVALEA